MSRVRASAVLALSFLAALAVSSLIVQPPIDLPVARALLLLIRDLLAVAVLILLAAGLGTLLIRSGLPRLHPLTLAAMRALVGLGAVSVAVLLIGLAGRLPPSWLAWVLSLAALAVLQRPIRVWLAALTDHLAIAASPPPDRLTRWLSRGVAALLALSLLLALAPPTAWDALTYHLAGPQAYLQAGRILSVPDNHFLGFPQHVEMLYLWLMLLARPQAAAVLHWGFGVLTLILLGGSARRLGSPQAAWLAAVILLTGQSLWLEAGWPYVDLAGAAHITAAALILCAAGEASAALRTRLALWAGIFIGLAMSTKYTSAGAALGVAAAVAWISRREGAAVLLRRLTLTAGVAFLVFLPWLIKNALLDGNPISPFGWGTAGFDRLDSWYYLRPGTGLSLGNLLVVPLQATVFGREGHAPYVASISPLLVGLLPLIAVGWRRRPVPVRAAVVILLIISGGAYAAWLVGAAASWFLVQSRLLHGVFPLLALVGGLALDAPAVVQSRLRGLIGPGRAIVLVVLASGLLTSGVATVRAAPAGVLLGLESEQAYLLRRLGAHYAAMQEINRLPPDARVLTLWEPRIFYCEQGRCVPDSLINQWWHDRQVQPDPGQIASQWQQEGITHVLIFEAGLDYLYREEPHEPLSAADMAALDELRRRHMMLLWNGYGAYNLYALTPGGLP